MKTVIRCSYALLLLTLLIACNKGANGTAVGSPNASSPASLGNLVWLDSNRDGIQDPDEVGVKGVTVELNDAQGAQVATAITDADGHYSFAGLEPGTYSLRFDLPADFLFSPQDNGKDDTKDSDPNPDTGRTFAFQLQAGQENFDWDAGIYPRPSAPQPEPSPTSTPTNTPPPPPTPQTVTTCTCSTPGVKFIIVSYDNNPGWSDCGQATACHSIIGDAEMRDGTTITDPRNHCSMQVFCPAP
jgi:hypothetical protein